MPNIADSSRANRLTPAILLAGYIARLHSTRSASWSTWLADRMSRHLAVLFAIAFVAMAYELIEWGYAAYGGNAEAGANFLGSQGDIWDAQKDMLMDTMGAVAAAILFLVLPRSRHEVTHASG